MLFEEACRNVALIHLGKPGTLVKCMIGSTYHGQKGNAYVVDKVRMGGLRMMGDAFIGSVIPNKYKRIDF